MIIQRRTHKKSYLRRLIATFNVTNAVVISAFVLTMIYGTYGTYFLRHQFAGINNLNDAFYYTVVVCSTLGDNRMNPLTTVAEYFTVSLVIFGFGLFATVGSIIIYQVVNHLNKMVHKFQGGRVRMRNHIILCGYSVVTELLINKFIQNHTPFLLLDSNLHPELNSSIENINFMCVSVPNRLDNLIKANIESCKSIIATSDSDSENILAAVNASNLKRQFQSEFKIVIRILYEEHIEVAKNSGATDVISPTLMAANAIIDLL